MLGIWGSHSGDFLVVASILTLLFAAPMLFWPLGWARALGWKLPRDIDLAVYFGRCLGGVVVVLALLGLVAVARPSTQPFYFLLVLAVVAMNMLVHVWGAIRKIQPRSETIEIAVWVALFLAGLAFYPNPP